MVGHEKRACHENLLIKSSVAPHAVANSQKKSILANLKRSTKLRAKKAKLLGLEDVELGQQDILFLNSLTAKDMGNLGHKCEILFLTSDDIDNNKLKDIEEARCGSMLALVHEG